MKDTIQHIRDAVKSGNLLPAFRAAQVNKVLGITYAGNFMSKHSKLKKGNGHIYFIRKSIGLYSLK
jgi:hypothetical protein